MEYGFLAESELSDSGVVSGFIALSERYDAALILLAKDAIVDD